MELMTEVEIIEGCKKLERHCQKMLVSRYSGMLFTVARRYCIDDFLAREALQEGLIRVFKYIGSFDSKKGDFQSWMKKIVANESIKILKKNQGIFLLTDISELKSPNASALDDLHEEELIKLIQQLPIGYREVFNMYVIDGYSHKEIAGALGISESTSRSQLTRAKKLLKQKISMIENLQLCRKKA